VNGSDRQSLVSEGLKTIREACEFTRLSRSDLYSRMERGEIPYVKLGRRRLIPHRALVELAATGLVVRSA
jgi:excisionase family DNA binding protein